MRIAGAALAAACLVLLPAGARSQTADLTRLTCGQLLDLRGAEPERLLVWLHGYYAGAAQRAILDPRQIEEAVAAMRKACEGSRDLALIGTEARAIFLSQKSCGRGQAAGATRPSTNKCRDAKPPADAPDAIALPAKAVQAMRPNARENG